MKPNPLYGACVRRAAQLLGGFEQLGARLGIDPRILQQWGQGIGAPGEYLFLKIVDIVLDDARRRGAAPGSQQDQHPRR